MADLGRLVRLHRCLAPSRPAHWWPRRMIAPTIRRSIRTRDAQTKRTMGGRCDQHIGKVDRLSCPSAGVVCTSRAVCLEKAARNVSRPSPGARRFNQGDRGDANCGPRTGLFRCVLDDKQSARFQASGGSVHHTLFFWRKHVVFAPISTSVYQVYGF